MAEADHRLPQILDQAQARITTASHVLAQLRARNAVKDEMRKQGLKVSHYAAREIRSWARVPSPTPRRGKACDRGLDCTGPVRKEGTRAIDPPSVSVCKYHERIGGLR